ncbi:hypothetical protein CNMCM8980_005656 [Aspergillus fumigatiaffinis]|nr:hypothetical protein CNMCM8980_005656 [Aspergillus fumigatiaffinis]
MEKFGRRARSREAEKLAVRYRKFNLPALLDAAVNVTGLDDAQCIKVLKCVEGQYNKALVLTMSTGQEIVARLPNPNAGPTFYTTASEVATRQFLRDRLGVPIPRIYAWSADESNAVGAEYILEEKAIGQPLGSLWDKLPLSSRLHIVEQIVDIEKKLASITFLSHGCIYYQSDLESRQPRPSFALVPGQNRGLPKFAIGPLTHPKYWQGKRALMELDRGPWSSIVDYALAIGKNEIQWAEEHARPRMNFQRSVEEPETPADYISMLQRYNKLVRFLVPPSLCSEQTITVSHPDLHLDNIFVDPQTNHITSIIDWQHVSASPIFLQGPFPQMLELSQNAQAECQVIEKQLLEFYFERLKNVDPFRWRMLSEPLHSIKAEIISLVPCCWDREDLFSLRNAMITALAHWNEISGGGIKRPIEFTDKELEQHQNEMELVEGVSMILHQLQEDGLISLGGMVSPERYEDARKWNNYFKQEFINLAEDEKQRELHAKPSRDIVRGSGASQTRQPSKQLHPLRLLQTFKLQTFFHSTLAVAIRSAGDPTLAETLHKISNSRGRITSCREKILSTDPDLDPENWFKCWESKSGDKLSSKQAIRLAALIKRWSRRTGEDTQTLKDWISNPSTFWGMDPFRTPFEFVRHCLELAEKTEGKEPIRRRVTLIVLYDIISEEISRLRRQSNQLRHQKYLTSAVKNIVAKAYHSQNASERTKLHTRLTYLQRYGEKWSRLERREIVLAPLDNARDKLVTTHILLNR